MSSSEFSKASLKPGIMSWREGQGSLIGLSEWAQVGRSRLPVNSCWMNGRMTSSWKRRFLGQPESFASGDEAAWCCTVTNWA